MRTCINLVVFTLKSIPDIKITRSSRKHSHKHLISSAGMLCPIKLTKETCGHQNILVHIFTCVCMYGACMFTCM